MTALHLDGLTATDTLKPGLSPVQHTLLTALNSLQIVAEFAVDGTLTQANPLFFRTLGYSPDELLGQHHSLWCPTDFSQSQAYENLWQALGNGQRQSGDFKRVRKDGKPVYLHGSYLPVPDAGGAIVKVVLLATDITT